MKKCIIFATSLLLAASSFGEEFGGIEFPQGALSFADEVVEYDPSYSGGAVPTHPDHIDPNDALGIPDYPGGSKMPGSVSLGSGGRIILKFTNNKLTGSDDSSLDLHVFEIGSDVEDTFVDISSDGTNWYSIGKVYGSIDSIDIDAYGFSSSNEFTFVRLTDDPNEGSTGGDTVGADIDAVGAISTTPVQHTPDLQIETAILIQFQSLQGSTYTIEQSTNLVLWTDAVTNIVGDGTIKKYFFEATTPATFYRIQPPPE